MPISILMPALSPTMTHGNLVRWHKNEGDAIQSGELLAEIETDKATMEIEAVDEGVLGKILIEEGAKNIAVNTPIALLFEEGESVLEGSFPDAPLGANFSEEEKKPIKEVPAPEFFIREDKNYDSAQERIFITPLAKRIAHNHNISLEGIKGSGPNGRIIKSDVEGAIKISPELPDSALSYTEIKITSMRRVIAARLTVAKQTIPHFYLSLKCQIDSLLQIRKQLNDCEKIEGKLSVNDFIIRACALSLQDVPEANVSWNGNTIRHYHQSDIAVAVAIEGGLVTPILKNCSNKTLSTISTEIKALAKKGKEGKLIPEEYQGGSFTLSNLGMFGVENFTAILNPPQACILAVGMGKQETIIKNNAIEIGTLMSCTLSVDHRAVDGAIGARFLQTLKSYLENPLSLLI